MAAPVKKKSQSRKREKPSFEKFVIHYGWTIVMMLPLMMYVSTLNFKLTQLDDYIFIIDKNEFNKHFGNIFKAFTIGVFNERDVYYRPLFLITFILEYSFGLKQDSLIIYHVTNIVLHSGCMLLLYRFLKQINIKPVPSLLLTLLFGLHPVLTMAVVWIPGRNDLLLTLFALLFFGAVLKYAETGKRKYFILQVLWLFLAFFTKETAIFLPLVAFCLYWLFGAQYNAMFTVASGDSNSASGKRIKYNYAHAWVLLSWALIYIVWYAMRLQGIDEKYTGRIIVTLSQNIERLPAYLLYLGKIFIPINLSVFPSVSNGNLVFGFISAGIIAALIVFTKNRNYKIMAFGLLWFVVFILPFFFVPKEINDQVFEHRLYLPLIGILIFLSQTLLFNGQVKQNYILAGCGVVFVAFFIISFRYIKDFEEPIRFWRQAVAASPQSSYAHKILGARLIDIGEKKEAIVHFQEAYRLNKEEKHVRFFIVRDVLEPMDSLDKSEKLLREEIALNPTYVEAYFELSHIFFIKEQIDSSFKYLLKSREFQPADKIINNNLLLTYIKLNDYKGAKEQANHMVLNGLTLDPGTLNTIENIPH